MPEFEVVSPHTPQELEILVEVSRILTKLDLDQVLSEVVSLATREVNASRGTFFLFEDSGGLSLQRFMAARNYNPDMKQQVSDLILGDGLAGWVYSRRQAALVADTLTDKRWVQLAGDREVARSVLCVPFMSNLNHPEEVPRGILTLEHTEPNHFTERHLYLVQIIMSQASIAMLNAQLFDKTMRQQRQLQAVFNSTTNALLTIDERGVINQINPTAADILEVGSAEVNRLTLDDLALRNPLMFQIRAAMHEANMIGGTQSFELQDQVNRRDYAVSVSRLRDSQRLGNSAVILVKVAGGVVTAEDRYSQSAGAVITLQDVTTLKDLNRLKTHMLYVASHDLKQPLNLMVGYLDLIREEVEIGNIPPLDFVDSALHAVDQMTDKIQRLLNRGRMEQTTPIHYETVNPYELIEQVMADNAIHVQARRHTVVQEIALDIPSLIGNPDELREAMNNLFSNAVKYTPDGGTITIRLWANAIDERIYFSVTDNGIGIPEDQQASIFNKYFRADQAIATGIEGTGLGLSLVKEAVEQHGGNVSFQSEENRGSTFGFWLPILR